MFSIFAEYLITPIWINTAVRENIWTVSVENFYILVLYKIVWNFISTVIKQICPDYIGKNLKTVYTNGNICRSYKIFIAIVYLVKN